MRQPLKVHHIGEHLHWPEERWRALQASRLADHLRHAVTSPLYRSTQIPPVGELTSDLLPGVLAQLPFTTKDQLAAAGRKALAVAADQVREWVCTSGTAGKPLDVPLTASDLNRLAENEAVALDIAGVGSGDLLLLAVGMDRLFIAGLAYWLGAQRLGAACVRIGPQLVSQPEFVSQLLSRLRPIQKVFIIAVPTFLKAVTRPVQNLGGIIAIGEATRSADLKQNALIREFRDRFLCPVMSTYAATETCATFAEGQECTGGHLNPALAIVEIINERGMPVSDETVGEVVVTPLGVQGMPLIRFRTGDIAALYSRPCPCGRSTPRLGPIMGRRHQLLKLSGTSVYASAIIESMHAIPDVANFVVLAEHSHELTDHVTLFVQLWTDSLQIRTKVEHQLRSLLRVTPEIQYVSGAELVNLQSAATKRKVQYFIDRRLLLANGF